MLRVFGETPAIGETAGLFQFESSQDVQKLRFDPNGPDAASVTIPDAHLLFTADFRRAGNDLVLTGEDGHKLIVADYFATDKRPTLLAPDGAMLAPQIVDALAGPQNPGQYAQAGGAPQSAQPVVGRIELASGNATIVRNGVAIAVNVGESVRKGDVVQTGADGKMGIVFTDGTAFSLTANSRMVVNEFVYQPNGAANASLISLVQGSISFVAGQVAKTGDMRVDTPVATMGIRGTAVLININSLDGTVSHSVLLEQGNIVGEYKIYQLGPLDANGLPTRGAEIATVNNAQIGWVVTPSAAGATAQSFQKDAVQLQLEIAVYQQVFQIFNQGQQNPVIPDQVPDSDPNRRGDLNDPNPQDTGGPRGTQFASQTFQTPLTLPNSQGDPTKTNVVITFTPLGDIGGNAGIGGPNPASQTQTTQTRNVIIGTGGNDTLIGTDGDDLIIGGAGDDLIDAGDGNDIVDAGPGNDTIIAGHGGGNDFYDGGPDIDTIKFESTTLGVTVNLLAGFAFGPEIGFDTLVNIENVTGGSGNDIIIGTPGVNVIHGGPGNDIIDGGGGADQLFGDDGNDIIIVRDFADWFADGGDGVDILRLVGDAFDFVSNDAGTLRNIEIIDLRFAGIVSIEISPNDLAITNSEHLFRILANSNQVVVFESGPPGGGAWIRVAQNIPYNPEGLTPGIEFDQYEFHDANGVTIGTIYLQRGAIAAASNRSPTLVIPTNPTPTAIEDLPSLIGGLSVADADNDLLFVSLTSFTPGATLTLTQTAGLNFVVGTGSGDGAMSFTGSVANINAALASLSYLSAQDFNGAGQVFVSVTDVHSLPVGGILTINVTPVNDAPTIQPPGVPDPGALNAPAGIPGVPLELANNLSFGDVDAADTHTVTGTFNAGASNVGAPLGTFVATLLNGTTNGTGGLLHWTYTVDPAVVNALPRGAHRTEVFNVVVDDGNGGAALRQVTISINGPPNQAPTINGQVSGSVYEDTSVASAFATGHLTASDPENDPVSWSIQGGSPVNADFFVLVDDFAITRNGNPFFHDDFADGNAPPSGPAFGIPPATTPYSTSGLFVEADGRLVAYGPLAESTGAGVGTPIVFASSALRLNSNTDSSPGADNLGLKQHMTFDVRGKFELLAPQDPREAYGIDLRDVSPAQTGNDELQLVVRRSPITGEVEVAFRDLDRATNTLVVLGAVTLSSIAGSAGAYQILLRFDHSVANSDEIHASFDLLANGASVGSFDFDTLGAGAIGHIFSGENWTRAGIVAFEPAEQISVREGTYGFLTIDQDGNWKYVLAANDPDTQALAQGQVAHDVFTILTNDGFGGMAARPIDITVIGTNDAPVVDLDSANVTIGGDGYEASLVADGNPVPISAAPAVGDVDDTLIASARVTLTDGAAGDFFFLPPGGTSGALASGISWSILGAPGNSGDPLRVEFSGQASAAAYADAIAQIGFGANPTAPNGDRHIGVVVNDGLADSNVALATLHVSGGSANNPPMIDATAPNPALLVEAGVTPPNDPFAGVSFASVTLSKSDPDSGDAATFANFADNGWGTVALTPFATGAGATGHSYVYVGATSTWIEANAIATALGGHLATISSAEENQFVLALTPTFSPFAATFLGGSDAAVDGEWRWIDSGEQFWNGGPNGFAVAGAYANWNAGEPNNNGFGPGGESYLTLRSDGTWNDVSGTALGNGFVIEFDALAPGFELFAQDGTYGRAWLAVDDNAGAIAYLLDNFRSETDSLGQGDAVFDNFTVSVIDGSGAPDSITVPFAVQGTNDPVFLYTFSTPLLFNAVFSALAGNDRASGIVFANNTLYVVGNHPTNTSNQDAAAYVAAFAPGPGFLPVWNAGLPGHSDDPWHQFDWNFGNFLGVAADANAVYGFGYSHPDAGITFDTGQVNEIKSIAVAFNADGTDAGTQGVPPYPAPGFAATNFFAEYGTEQFRGGIATVQDRGSGPETILYAFGNGQPAGAPSAYIVASYDRFGIPIAFATDSSAGVTFGAGAPGAGASLANDAVYWTDSQQIWVIGTSNWASDGQTFDHASLWQYDSGLDLLGRTQFMVGNGTDIFGDPVGEAATFRAGTIFNDTLFVVGNTYGAMSDEDSLIVSYDRYGNENWRLFIDLGTLFGGVGKDDALYDVVAANGHLYAVGRFTTVDDDINGVLVEIDAANGALISWQQFGGPGDEMLNAIATDGKLLYIAGQTNSDTVFNDFDSVLLAYALPRTVIEEGVDAAGNPTFSLAT
ncbi:MAG: FecR domain-containing protein, partial [Proteobacteria bacterium]|nr:FecR domain-containing protein [Pseudomonadota bacterium]